MNKTVLFCAYKSVLCEGMTLETQYLGSRPTRACELKFTLRPDDSLDRTSRPTRACELKYQVSYKRYEEDLSRPTRACELKFKLSVGGNNTNSHALHGRVS